MWRPGSKLVHPFNRELGVGVVLRIDGRYLHAFFPEAGRELTLSAKDGGFRRLVLDPGVEAELTETRERVVIAETREHEYLLEDGRLVPDAAVWPILRPDTPLERLASLEVGRTRRLVNRLDGLRLLQLREAGGLGSVLGGRVELYAHQLHTVLRALQDDPVRWLLADEVGLGKTIEACLVLSALRRTGRAERALVVVPETLAIQWLGELYRKFHEVFDLLDRPRIDGARTAYEEDVNPFEVHPFAVVSLELLAENPELQEEAIASAPDLVVVDEAHRLVRSPARRALGQLVGAARHALLLTATPLRADRPGFYHLLNLLHPEAFPDYASFCTSIDAGEAVLPCTSSVGRADVGGLPPRVPVPVDVGPTSADVRKDARAVWLAQKIREWSAKEEKALVFCQDVDTVEALKRFLEAESVRRVAMFHERMPTERRDIELAAFRASLAPVLLCSAAGGEGRNFQFCDRMVHYDLPYDPVVLEQRIGRLDRIGRQLPVEIVYFRPEDEEPDVARLYERLDLFARPSAGLDEALSGVAPALRAALAGAPLQQGELVEAVDAYRAQSEREPLGVLYEDAYRASMADEILALVPDDLDVRTARFCVPALEGLGCDVVVKDGKALYYVELGSRARVDALPGVPGGTRYLGTFDRQEAVERDELEFFASGHPLVEGLLLELEDGSRGRAALCELTHDELRGGGLFGVYKEGADWSLEVVDSEGQPRPDWAEAVTEGLASAKDVNRRTVEDAPGWGEAIRDLGEALEGRGDLVAAAFFRWRASE